MLSTVIYRVVRSEYWRAQVQCFRIDWRSNAWIFHNFNRLCRELRRWREAEVTHGRVSMLAALGFIVQVQAEYFLQLMT